MAYAKKIAAAYNIKPNKKLGQNFLVDELVIANIINAVDIRNNTILEIGSGTGNMTKELLRAGAKRVIAIEFDKRCFLGLQLLKNQYQNLKIINGDALKIKEEDLIADGEKLKVVANLPYNVSTALLIKWLKRIHLFSSLTLMLQKEVVDRIIASKSTHNYSSLSVILQWVCYVEKLFDVAPESFWPIPKVVSSVVRLTPHKKPLYDCTLKKLDMFLRIAFAKKRKTLCNNLKVIFGGKTEVILQNHGLMPTVRAEELSIDQFCKLANLASNESF